jgi:hypothetical protein
MDGCIAKMLKLLIWSEKHLHTKEKTKNGRGMIGAGSKKGNGDDEVSYLW